MSTPKDTAPQLTICDDSLFDPPPTEWKDWPKPFGWDNPVDIDRAKDFLTARQYQIIRKEGATNHVVAFAQAMRDFGISHRLAVDLIITHAKPPLDGDTIRKAVDRFYEVAQSAPGANSLAGGPTRDEKDVGESWPRPIEYDPKQHAAKNAQSFIRERPAKIISSDGVLFTRDGDLWREMTDDELAAEIRDTDPKVILDTNRVQTMVREVHISRHTKARPFEWIDKPNDAPDADKLILFRNGVLDYERETLLPHTDRFFATGLPAVDYASGATCPLWLEKIGEWLAPSYHDTLQEFMGYALTSDTSIEVLLAMIGATRGGKGTISFVMQSLIGASHYTSRTLNDLGSPFGLEGCTDKRAIFVPDAHDSKVDNRNVVLDRIKSITGNDPVSVNRKYESIVTTRIPAKIVLVANRHPKLLDESGALAAREILLVFSNSFRGREDRELRAKLHAELPGIANWALDGLWRLRFNANRFTIGAEGREASRELAESQSPALRFANEYLTVTGDAADYVPVPDVYRAYEAWALDEGLSGRTRRDRDDFKHDLLAALGTKGVTHTRKRWHDPTRPKIGKGKIMRGFFGLKFKRVLE